jgi:hypothetical protein
VQLNDLGTLTFNPDACESCIQEKENRKFFFENKKIFIRQKDNEDEVQIIEIKDSDENDMKPVRAALI